MMPLPRGYEGQDVLQTLGQALYTASPPPHGLAFLPNFFFLSCQARPW